MYYYQQNPYSGMPVYTPQQSQSQGLKGRPVSSLDEVRAAQIDFDGSLFVFPDIANNRIYTKQISMDGTATLRTYALVPEQKEVSMDSFVTRDEFQNALEQIKIAITGTDKPVSDGKEKVKFNF